jgi:hypothetical protein
MGLNSDLELFRVYTAAAASRNDGIFSENCVDYTAANGSDGIKFRL